MTKKDSFVSPPHLAPGEGVLIYLSTQQQLGTSEKSSTSNTSDNLHLKFWLREEGN